MGYAGMMDDFLAYVKTGAHPVSDFRRAAADLETVFRAYESGGILSDSGD